MNQHLHEAVTTDQVNDWLDEGAVITWIQPAPRIEPAESAWHVVLEHPPESDERDIVLSFLNSVSPTALEEAMLSGGMGTGPGTAALEALAAMVHPELGG